MEVRLIVALALGVGMANLTVGALVYLETQWAQVVEGPARVALRWAPAVPWLLVPWLLRWRFGNWREFAVYGLAFGAVAGAGSAVFLDWRSHERREAFQSATRTRFPDSRLMLVFEDEDRMVFEALARQDGTQPFGIGKMVRFKWRINPEEVGGVAALAAIAGALLSLLNAGLHYLLCRRRPRPA